MPTYDLLIQVRVRVEMPDAETAKVFGRAVATTVGDATPAMGKSQMLEVKVDCEEVVRN